VKIQNSKYILALFPIGVFLLFYFQLKFDGLYGQDAYEYLRYSKALKNYLITGVNPGDYFWPLFYPIFGALLSFITQNVAVALLIVSVLSFSLSGFYLHKIINLLFAQAKHSVIYLFVFFIVSPIIFKNGMLIMSDMLSLCFIVLSVYHFLKFKKLKFLKNFYFLAVFSLLAFMTRYASAVVLLPFVISGVWLFFKHKKSLKHLLFIAVILGVLLLPHFVIRMQNPTAFLAHQWVKDWSFLNLFKRNFSTIDGNSKNSMPNIIFVFSNFFHPRFLFAGIVFIPFLWKYSLIKKLRIYNISIVLYALFLAGIPFQNSRFLIVSFPIILIILFPVFNYLSQLKFIKNLFGIGIVLSIILQFFLIAKIFKSTLDRNNFEIEMANLLQPYQQKTLYSFDVDIALQGRDLDFNYINLWYKRYYNLQKGDLILFHPTKFKEQWQGRNPMLNFNHFKDNYKLIVLKELPQGWKLYKIE